MRGPRCATARPVPNLCGEEGDIGGCVGDVKGVENHAHAVALHRMYYNFVRIHKTLRVTPAMAAGVTDRLWEIGDIVKLIEKAESHLSTKRGPYKKH
jgi:hypothetical protein